MALGRPAAKTQATMIKRISLFVGIAFILAAAPWPAPAASSSKASSTQSRSAKKKASAKSKSRKKGKTIRGQQAPTSDRIRDIQNALQQQGTLSGEPSGRWDDATVAAMKKFQAANGLNPSGKIDALSLHKLGLGSETAGKGAPLPPATPGHPASPVTE